MSLVQVLIGRLRSNIMKNRPNPKAKGTRQIITTRKKMTLNIERFIRALAWFLVVHFTTFSYAGRSHFVTTELNIRNEMKGLKRQEIVYFCQAINSGLEYGWRRAKKTPLGHTFHVLLEGGQKLEEEIHRCHFRSVRGTADVDIRMTAIDAEICNYKRACAVHEVTPEGIIFDGKEWDFDRRGIQG
ncbi:hypothetical protein Bca4012_062120 [Brassica carinata]